MARYLLFFGVAFAILAGMHVYVWRRLVRASRLEKRTRVVILLVVLALVGAMFTALFIAPMKSRDVFYPVSFLGYTWLGTLFYLVVLTAARDVAFSPLAIHEAVQKWRARRSASATSAQDLAPSQDRRLFLARASASVVAASSGGITLLGATSALGEIGVREVPVRLTRLPRALSGYRIAMISDVHIGPLLDRRFLAGVVDTINRRRPDLVAIVGDLVDGSVARIGADVAALGTLRARHGTFFVTGNHEYYSGVEEWTAFLARLGIRTLANERVEIGDTHARGARFDLAGVHDWHARRAGTGHAPDVTAALRGRDAERELVLLAHQPAQIEDAAAHGVGIQLSGHTHGGQIAPFNFLTKLAYPYVRGLHTHGEHTQIYVSCGTGFWGPPMRVLAPAEITEVTLVAG